MIARNVPGEGITFRFTFRVESDPVDAVANAPAQVSRAHALTPTSLTPFSLPHAQVDLRQTLVGRIREAVVVGDVTRLEELATEVAAAEPELGAAMSRRIRGYNYLGLLDLLGDGSTHGEETE